MSPCWSGMLNQQNGDAEFLYELGCFSILQTHAESYPESLLSLSSRGTEGALKLFWNRTDKKLLTHTESHIERLLSLSLGGGTEVVLKPFWNKAGKKSFQPGRDSNRGPMGNNISP